MNIYEEIQEIWEKSRKMFEQRIQEWADTFERKREQMETDRSLFRAWKPLGVYVSYSLVKGLTSFL